MTDLLILIRREAGVERPVKLTGNLVTADDMRNLLANSNLQQLLLFSPSLNSHQQVDYTIRPFQRTAAGDVFDDGSIKTNPSPPATATQAITAKVAMAVL